MNFKENINILLHVLLTCKKFCLITLLIAIYSLFLRKFQQGLCLVNENLHSSILRFYNQLFQN